MLKEEKTKHKYTTHITFYENTLSNKQNISYVIISVNMLIFQKNMGPLNDEDTLQVNGKQQKLKKLKNP